MISGLRRLIEAATLFLGWRDAMVRQLAIGLLASPGLFAHRLPANAVLAGLANAHF
jgi:hypothetical protein